MNFYKPHRATESDGADADSALYTTTNGFSKNRRITMRPSHFTWPITMSFGFTVLFALLPRWKRALPIMSGQSRNAERHWSLASVEFHKPTPRTVVRLNTHPGCLANGGFGCRVLVVRHGGNNECCGGRPHRSPAFGALWFKHVNAGFCGHAPTLHGAVGTVNAKGFSN